MTETAFTTSTQHTNSNNQPAPDLLLDEASALAGIETLSGDALALYRLWGARDAASWGRSARLHCALAQKLLDCGEPLLAFDVLHQFIATGAADVRSRQLCAMALLRSGSIASALSIMEALYASGSRDEETIGLLARAHKGLAFAAGEEQSRKTHLARALALYREAYQLTGGYWTGINAATLALVLHDVAEAEALARKVENDCRAILSKAAPGESLFWPTATLAEAALILGEPDVATEYYSRTVQLGPRRYGDIASARRNAELILNARGAHFPVRSVLPVPAVFCFSGHMVDLPGRAKTRLPDRDLDRAAGEIRQALNGEPAICYASGACGSDILFLEANLENRGENYIVLPFPPEQFIEYSVRPGGEEWVGRFQRLLASARNVLILGTESSVSNEFYFRHASQMSLGFARLKARELDTDLRGLTVWDGIPSYGAGGTGDAVEDWRAAGLQVEVITPPSVAPHPELPERTPHQGSAAGEFTPEIRAMLFGDVVGFSKLSESQMPIFVTQFLALVGKVKDEMQDWIEVVNTWGDGIYIVFRRAEHAGMFALTLRDRVTAKDWSAVGLPKGLSLRIGLHAGPVYSCTDPVTNSPAVIGANVVRAARIEPITPPGGIYTSHEFAALAAFENCKDFRCEYVGRIPAAKAYGEYPTFCLFPETA